MIKGIIFDYGGTIDSRGHHWSHIIAEGYAAAGLEVAEEEFRRAYVETEREFARHQHVAPTDTFRTLMHKKIAVELGYLVQWGVLEPGALSQAYAAAEYCYDYAQKCCDEARPVIAALAQRYPLVLVSNFYGNVEAVLADMGLAPYFRAVVESARVGVRKPDPAIFALGLKALDLPADEVLVVGDSLRKDILPARSLGCHTAWIKGRGWTADEDAATDAALIPSLQALCDTLL